LPGFNKRGSNYDVERHLKDNPGWKPPVEFFQFCGEKKIRDTYEDAEIWDIKGYFAGLFVTGARASEFLTFKCNQFDYDKDNDVYWGRNLPVYKREKGAKRTINWLAEDPLAKEFWNFLETVRKNHGPEAYVSEYIRQDRQDWLTDYEKDVDWYNKKIADNQKLPASERMKNFYEKQKMKSKRDELRKQQQKRIKALDNKLYQDLYSMINQIDAPPLSTLPKEKRFTSNLHGPFFPSRLRFERASFLVAVRGFRLLDVRNFFNWKAEETALTYIHMSGQEVLQANLDARMNRLQREKARSNTEESIRSSNTRLESGTAPQSATDKIQSYFEKPT
jgi:hypothetical protein